MPVVLQLVLVVAFCSWVFFGNTDDLTLALPSQPAVVQLATLPLEQVAHAHPTPVVAVATTADGRPDWEAMNDHERYQWHLKDVAYRHGVPFEIAHAQIMQESGFRPKVCSNAGACGIAQFIKSTAKGLGVNRDDPYNSLEGAMKHMAELRHAYGGWEVALAAYNGGGDGARFAQRGLTPSAGQAIHAHRRSHGSYFDWRQNKHYVESIMAKAKTWGYGSEKG